MNEKDREEIRVVVKEAIAEVATATARREDALANHSAAEFRNLQAQLARNERSQEEMKKLVAAQNLRVSEYGHIVHSMGDQMRRLTNWVPEEPPKEETEKPPEPEEPKEVVLYGQCRDGTHFFEKEDRKFKHCVKDGSKITWWPEPRTITG